MIRASSKYIGAKLEISFNVPYYTEDIVNYDLIVLDPAITDVERLVAASRWAAQYTGSLSSNELLRQLGLEVLELCRAIVLSAGLGEGLEEINSAYDRTYDAEGYDADRDAKPCACSGCISGEACSATPSVYAGALLSWGFLADRPEFIKMPYRIYLVAQAKDRSKARGAGAHRQRRERDAEQRELANRIKRGAGYSW